MVARRWVLCGAASLIAGCNSPPEFRPYVQNAEFHYWPPDSGAFVLRIGRDTLKVERFVLDGNHLRSESVWRGGVVEYQTFDATLNDDASVKHAELRVYAWPGDSAAPPTARVTISTTADSTIIEQGIAHNVKRTAMPGHAQIFNGVAIIPFIAASYVAVAFRGPVRVGDSVVMEHIIPSLGWRRLVMTRLAPDTLLLYSSFQGPVRLVVDRNNRLRELDGVGSSLSFIGSRHDGLSLDSAGRDFSERNRTVGGIAVLSPRDNAVATINGAHLVVDYGRPSKRGRVIFGEVVPWNRVWRTGANLATHFTTDRALKFGDTVVPEGTYTIFTLPTPTGWTLIINRQTGQWGTEYNQTFDLDRIPMTVATLASPLEKFTISIEPLGLGGVLRLRWDTTEASAVFTAPAAFPAR